MPALSSIQGKITRIALSTHETKPEALQSYGPILRAFDPDVSFVIMVRAPADQLDPPTIDQLETAWTDLLQNPPRPLSDNPIFFAPRSLREPRRWIQDYFAVLTHHAGPTHALLKPFPDTDHHPHTHYTDEFSHVLDTFVKPVPFPFQGGNLLVIDDTLLLGRDTPLDDHQHLLQAMGLPKILPLGTDQPLTIDLSGKKSRQPFFHLDLYLTPGGHTSDGQPIALLAELQDQCITGVPPSTWPQVRANIQTSLQHTAQQLLTAGFHVHRLPIVIHLFSNSFHVYSYNNIKVEAFHNHKRAYLPQYHRTNQPRLNQIFTQALTHTTAQLHQVGFTHTRTISSNLLTLASQSRGGLHCLAKAIARTP